MHNTFPNCFVWLFLRRLFLSAGFFLSLCGCHAEWVKTNHHCNHTETLTSYCAHAMYILKNFSKISKRTAKIWQNVMIFAIVIFRRKSCVWVSITTDGKLKPFPPIHICIQWNTNIAMFNSVAASQHKIEIVFPQNKRKTVQCKCTQ